MTHRQLQAEPTAQSLGFHMPAEWEPAERAWVTWPDNQETWPGCLDAAQQQFADLISQLRPHVEPCTTQSVNIPTNDSWIRDYGPVFVIDRDGHLACHDFTFNCWGRKYEPYDDDDRVPRHIAKHLGVPFWIQPMVLEGGSIDVNGAGTVMTTRQCLLESRRNPGRSQAWIQQQLHHVLGTVHVVWLPGGITGDDTDGHVDDVARFINPTTVAAVRAPRGHPDHAVLEQNWRSLNEACDQDGVKLDLLELPVPNPIHYTFPPDETGAGGRRQLPASYANFFIANQAVFVPVFGQHQDDTALRRLDDAMPGHSPIGVRCEHLVAGLGAIHCLTMQQPRVCPETDPAGKPTRPVSPSTAPEESNHGH